MTTNDHLSSPPAERAFDGDEYAPERDFDRLNSQMARVFRVMRDGRWRTLDTIGAMTSSPTTSVSARLRDLRKRKWGSHMVGRRYVDAGLYEYRLEVNEAGMRVETA